MLDKRTIVPADSNGNHRNFYFLFFPIL